MAEAAAATTDKGTAAAAPATGATTTTDKGAAGAAAAAATTATTGKTAATSTTDTGTATNDVKAFWPENWQERVSKGDDKRASTSYSDRAKQYREHVYDVLVSKAGGASA